MENKFQTSFIPKRPLINDQKVQVRKGASIFMFVSMILFIASTAGAIFVVLWGIILTRAQENYKTQLAENERHFKTSQIEDLKRKNAKIDLSKRLLDKHTSTSEVFEIFSNLTTEGIRFNTLEFSSEPPPVNGQDAAVPNDQMKVFIKGTAKSFVYLAFQSDILGQSDKYGLNKALRNPMISDLSLQENGDVTFGMTANIAPADVLYKDTVPN